MHQTAEHQRISGSQRQQWHRWGSFVAGRAWGTMRETTPDKPEPWAAFPFEHGRSRAYRWSEDGIGGFCDDQQRICMALALWNEQDPILKERYFGLTNEQGTHGEGIRDYFFHIDGLPSYSYMKMVYKYPQVEFPYERLVHGNALRGKEEPAFELIDALEHTFAHNRYFDVFIEYAKAAPDDILCRITAVNRGDDAAPLHLLPQLWFRRTWDGSSQRPELRAISDETVRVQHPDFGELWWSLESPDALLFTENETNTALLFDQPNDTPYVKDGIDYAIVRGQKERVNPERCGTKAAAHHIRTLKPGESWVIRTRLRPQQTTSASAAFADAAFADFDDVFEQRQREADAFYTALHPSRLDAEERRLQRAAYAGLCWNKNFYHFNVDRWLKENEEETSEKTASFKDWRHLDAHDVMSIPDTWEFPWFAQWDLAFQLSTLCISDAGFAKQQVLLLLSERYMRDDGAIPAFEDDLSTPHPPLFAWAAWHVYQGTPRDPAFLRRAYDRLKLHHDWWLKTQQHQQTGLFGGGFLGMDNISVFNRNADVPEGAWLAQADGTGWMALFSLNMLAIAVELGEDADAVAFLEHFLKIRRALLRLWDDKTRFFYDYLYLPGGRRMPLKVRSIAGLVPLVAAMAFDPIHLQALPRLQAKIDQLRQDDPDFQPGKDGCYLLAALDQNHIAALVKAVFDEDEFYSPFGIRSLSRYHEKHPVTCKIGGKTYALKYEPGDTADNMFGGNSNWRGPLWTPLNTLLSEVLYTYHTYFDGSLRVGRRRFDFEQQAFDLVARLISLFKRNEDGMRPYFGSNTYFQTDPHWRDYVWFYEHFHAETGQGLGASHQNGWTAMVAKLLQTQGRAIQVSESNEPPQ